VYGSDAIAGVVQVFTRKAGGKPYVEIGAGLGSLGSAKADLSVSGSSGQLDYALTLANEASDGFNARPSSDPLYTPDIDNWRNHSVSARLAWNLNDAHRLEVLSMQSHSNAGYDASAKPKPGVDDRSINDNLSARAQWTAKWSDQWQSELSVGHATDRYETTPSVYLTETQTRSYTLHNSLKLGPGQLNLQLERREDRLISSGLLLGSNGKATRHQDAVGAAYLLSQDNWDAQVHLRHDKDSEFGGINTGTLAAGFRFTPQWRVWASAGSAFRAPTLYQSFSQYGPKPGSPKLKAERGRNREAGISYGAGSDELTLTAYSNQVRDLISWDAQFVANCPPSKNPQPWDGCYGNLAKVNLKGVSLKGATDLGGLRVSGSVDWQSPKDAKTGLRLGRRAAKHASLRVDKVLGPWAMGAQLQVSGMRFDFNDNKTRLGGFALLNLDVQYEVNSQLRLVANLDNAFNRAYQTAGGYAQAPRTVFVGLRYSPSL
jgi:vitamin B12 transporter